MKPATIFRSALILSIIFTVIFISPIRSRMEAREDKAWLAWANAQVSQPEAMVQHREQVHRRAADRLNLFDAIVLSGMIGCFLVGVAVVVVERLRQRRSPFQLQR